VAQQRLDRADVVAVLEQVGGERVAETASDVRNRVTSATPISVGWRLPWNRMERRL
jgi:hypothetical protein